MSNLITNKMADKNALAKSASGTLKEYINKYIPEIEKALPNCGVTPERFARLMTSAISSTPKLADCTPKSFLGAMITAASLGLEPNTPLGQAYLIPYGKEAQMQLGYKGLLTLCYRSGQIKSVTAETVYENDEFEYELGLNSKLVHKPKMNGDRGKAIAYYAIYYTKDGGYGFSVMSHSDVEEHKKKYSKAQNSPWNTNFDEMAKKTVLKKALKDAPISTELMREVNQDESIHSQFRMEDLKDGSSIMDSPQDYIDMDAEVDSETGEIVSKEVGGDGSIG